MDNFVYLLIWTIVCFNAVLCRATDFQEVKIVDGTIGRSFPIFWEFEYPLEDEEITISKETTNGRKYEMYTKSEDSDQFMTNGNPFPRYRPIINGQRLVFEIETFNREDIGIYWAEIHLEGEDSIISRIVLTSTIPDEGQPDVSGATYRLCITTLIIVSILLLLVVFLVAIRVDGLEEMKMLLRQNLESMERETNQKHDPHTRSPSKGYQPITRPHTHKRRDVTYEREDPNNWRPIKYHKVPLNVEKWAPINTGSGKKEHEVVEGVPSESNDNAEMGGSKGTVGLSTEQNKHTAEEVKSVTPRSLDDDAGTDNNESESKGEEPKADTEVVKLDLFSDKATE